MGFTPGGGPRSKTRLAPGPSAPSFKLGGGPLAGRTKKKEKGGSSVGGFLGNLANDVESSVMGLYPGLAKSGKALGGALVHSVTFGQAGSNADLDKLLGEVGTSYKETYGPLAHGDVKGFAGKVYEHPLQPVLDALTVASVGAGGVARTARVVAPESKLARLDRSSVIKLESPAVKQGREGGKTLERPTSSRPLRKAAQLMSDKALGALPAQTPVVGEFARYAKELERLPRQDAMRLQLKAQPFAKAWAKLSNDERAAASLIARGVSPADYRGLLDREAASGTKVQPDMLQLLDSETIGKLYDQPTARMRDALTKGDALGKASSSILVERGRLTPEKVQQTPYRLAELASGKTADELRGSYQKAGRPEPIYLKDMAARERAPLIGRAGGGMGVPRNPVHQWKGTLAKTGQLALHPDQLTPSYLASVRYALHDDIHQALLDSAVKVGKGEPLPNGYVYVRRPTKPGGTTPEKIPHTQGTLADFRDQIAEAMPEDASGPPLTTREPAEAAANGSGHYYLAVPDALARRATGEFLRSTSAARQFIEKPTQVWRALVLNARPAWLVNNVVGNTLMYAIRNAGPAGLIGYAHAVRDAGKETSEFRKLVAEHFPEQVRGTFLQTQRPGGKLAKAGNIASAGLAPLDIGYEQLLRRAGVESALRKAPEVRARLKAMPQEAGRFEKAATQALEQNPHLARRVSDEVNSALGDFLNMSPFERQYIRSVFPFYGWYRAILGITLKLPADYPGRTDLLARIGEAASNETEQALGDLPPYLKGLAPISVGGGRARVLNTAPLNPYATIPQLGEDVSGTVNPFASGLARAILGNSEFDSTSPTQAASRFAGGVASTVTGLPQVRLAEALTGRLYQGTPDKPTLYARTPRDELLAYLGVPYRNLSLRRARELANK